MDKTNRKCFRSIDQSARQHQVERDRLANDTGQSNGADPRNHAMLYLRKTQARSHGCDPKIAMDGQCQAHSDRKAVQCGNDRLIKFNTDSRNGAHQGGGSNHRSCTLNLLNIRTRAKGLFSSAAKNNHAYLRISRGIVPDVSEPLLTRHIQSIQFIGTI